MTLTPRRSNDDNQGKHAFLLEANLAAMKFASFADQALENRGSIAWKSLLLKRKCPAIVCDLIFLTSTTKEIPHVFQ